jgi:hypothetical protein
MTDRLKWAVGVLAVLGILVVAAACSLIAATLGWQFGMFVAGAWAAVLGRSAYSVLAEENNPPADE